MPNSIHEKVIKAFQNNNLEQLKQIRQEDTDIFSAFPTQPQTSSSSSSLQSSAWFRSRKEERRGGISAEEAPIMAELRSLQGKPIPEEKREILAYLKDWANNVDAKEAEKLISNLLAQCHST